MAKIAIIGNGNVGGTLGKRWTEAGHEVVFGVRDPGQSTGSVNIASVEEAVAGSEIVVFATPYSALAPLAASLEVGARTLIDCTNPINADFSGLLPIATSAAEELAAATGSKKVVKAFNTIGFNIMENPNFNGHPATLLICGDDQEAKKTVRQLAEDIGFAAEDAGPLLQAKWLESLAWLWISMAAKFGYGRDIVFNLAKR
ncbi:MAG: NADPH-dependent F420 reductase [Armatimonadetes bacterium]|nr:NADPH-dependent F420 reductase [Armatimonadota bacterium]